MKKTAALLLCAAIIFPCGNVVAQDTGVQPAKSVEERIADLESQIEILKDSISEPEGGIQTTISDVKKLKQIKFSGYIQARYTNDFSQTSGSNSGGGINGFQVRRARLKADARPTDNTGATLQIDFAGGGVTTKDAYISYFLKGDPAIGPTVRAGQFLIPFGYQLTRSSSLRETPEFAEVTSSFFSGKSNIAGGITGPDVEYDLGAMYSSATDLPLTYEIGLFNSGGANTKNGDTYQAKNVVGRVRYALSDNLDAGTSFFFGKGPDSSGIERDRTRWGADIEWYLENLSMKAEYITGTDPNSVSPGTIARNGYWAQAAYNFTPKDTGVLMYDAFNTGVSTASDDGHHKTWHAGYIRWLDNATKLKFFYKMPNYTAPQLIVEALTVF